MEKDNDEVPDYDISNNDYDNNNTINNDINENNNENNNDMVDDEDDGIEQNSKRIKMESESLIDSSNANNNDNNNNNVTTTINNTNITIKKNINNNGIKVPMAPETRIKALICKIGDLKEDHVLLIPDQKISQHLMLFLDALKKDIKNGFSNSISESLILAIKTFPQKTEVYATLFTCLHFIENENENESDLETDHTSNSLTSNILSDLLKNMIDCFDGYSNFLRTKLILRFLCICTKLRSICPQSMLKFILNMVKSQKEPFIFLVISSYPWIESIIDHDGNDDDIYNDQNANETLINEIKSSLNSYQKRMTLSISINNRIGMGLEYVQNYKKNIDEKNDYFKRSQPCLLLPDQMKIYTNKNKPLTIDISPNDFPDISQICLDKRVHLPFTYLNLFSKKDETKNDDNDDIIQYKKAEWFIHREIIIEYIQLYAPSWKEVAQILKRMILNKDYTNNKVLIRIILEELMTCFLAVPQSLHGSVYYERILSYLCGSTDLANIIPPLVDDILDENDNVYYDDPELLNRLSCWVAYYIHSIGIECWLWESWAILDEKSKKYFLIHRALEYLDQLSYPGTLYDDIPSELAIPVFPINSSTFFPNNDAENDSELSAYQERASALFNLIKNRPKQEELLNFLRFDEVILKSFTSQDRLDIVTHTIIHAGQASISHLSMSFERNVALLIELGCNENDDNKYALLDSICSYWDPKKSPVSNSTRRTYQLLCSPIQFNSILSKLIELNILNSNDIARWCLKKERIGSALGMIHETPLPNLWASQDWFWRLLCNDIFGKHFSRFEQLKYKNEKILNGIEKGQIIETIMICLDIGKLMFDALDSSLAQFPPRSPHGKWYKIINRLYRPLIEDNSNYAFITSTNKNS